MKNFSLIIIPALIFITSSCTNAQSENEEELNIETEKVISMVMDNPNFNQTPTTVKEIYEEDLSGKIIMLDDESFIARITDIDNEKGLQYKGTTPCIVDFYADWCRPCNAMHPILMELAKEYKGKLIIYKINTDKATKTATALNINSIPTLLFFKRNAQPGIIRGGLPKKELKDVINQFLDE